MIRSILFLAFVIISIPLVSSADLSSYVQCVEATSNNGHDVIFSESIFDEKVLYWDSYSSIEWKYNLWNLVKEDSNDADSLFAGDLADAFNRWENESDVSVTFIPQGSTPDTTGTGDNENTLIFVDEDYYFWSGETDSPATTYFTWDTNNPRRILEVDIYFRNDAGNYEWSLDSTDEANGVYYLPRIATHEIGHMIGLGHYHNSYEEAVGDSVSIMEVLVDSYSVAINNDDKYLGHFLTTGHLKADYSKSQSNPFYITNDLTVDSGVTLSLKEYTGTSIYVSSGKEIIVNGTLSLDRDTVFEGNSGSSWDDIKLTNSSALDNFDDSSSVYRKITIKDATSGILVYYCSPTLKKVEADGCTNGIEITGTTSDPLIQYCTSKNNTYGIKVSVASADAVVDYCDINTNSSAGVYVNSSGYICLAGPSLNGNNTIAKDSGNYAVDNQSITSVFAENNYWDTSSPTSALFNGTVDWNPYRNSAASGVGAGKIGIPEKNSLKYAMDMELNGHFTEALNAYKSTIAVEYDLRKRKFILTSILRVIDKYDWNYTDLRLLLLKEMSENTDIWYRACVDFLLTFLLIREERIQEAAAEFVVKSADYKGTEMEVEMLCYAANIQGNNLNNKDTALALAKRAQKINPGSELVQLAYSAADVFYGSSQHEDIFLGKNGGFDNVSLLKNINFTKDNNIETSISVTPNPANPSTTINYSIAEPSHVKLVIYSVSGQKVAALVDGFMTAGKHSAVFDGSNLASGVYFYSFESKGFTKTGKMLLIK